MPANRDARTVPTERSKTMPANRDARTRVYNVRHDPFDVSIGRPIRSRPDLHAVGWGNPFAVRPLGFTAEQAVAAYLEWVQQQPDLLARLPELRGKRLGCWCAPQGGLDGDLNGSVCHGQILAALADALPAEVSTDVPDVPA
jgi:hypothetical protein